jgi:surface antigen
MLAGAIPLTASAATFTPRLTTADAPDRAAYSSGNPFRSSYIDDNKVYHDGNCTWYAFGRIREIFGITPATSRGDASAWYGYTQDGYSRGQTPKLGAIMCYSYGHVSVVEKIEGNTITYSESNYATTYFHIGTVTVGNYEAGFQGFIYVGDVTPNYTTRADNIGDDFYALIALTADKILTNASDKTKWQSEAKSNSQIFRFQRQSDGSYKISSLSNGNALDVSGAGTGWEVAIQFHPSNDSGAQRWRIEQNGGKYMFGPLCAPDKVMDGAGAQKPANDTNCYTYERNDSGAQWFEIRKIADVNAYLAPKLTAAPSAENGRFYIDGKLVTMAAYKLPSVGSNNYIRIRELAVRLKGTAKQFNIGDDWQILMGAEYKDAAKGDSVYVVTPTATIICDTPDSRRLTTSPRTAGAREQSRGRGRQA